MGPVGFVYFVSLRKASPSSIRECLNLEEIAEKMILSQGPEFLTLSHRPTSPKYILFLFSTWEKLL